MNQKEIQAQAKKIMDDFVSALSKVKKIEQRFGHERKICVREFSKKQEDKEFRQRVFKNAPKVKGDYLVAEKKSW